MSKSESLISNEIEIPLNDWIVGKRKYNLSMNTYRNLHHQISSKLKKQVAAFVVDRCNINYTKPVKIHYTLYFKDKRKRDLMNFVAVVDKFALDGLVNSGMIKDDNYNYVVGYTVCYGGKMSKNTIVMEIKEV